MSMTENFENDPLRFVLKDQTPGADTRFVVQCPSEDTKKTWVIAVQRILEMQGDFLRGIELKLVLIFCRKTGFSYVRFGCEKQACKFHEKKLLI